MFCDKRVPQPRLAGIVNTLENEIVEGCAMDGRTIERDWRFRSTPSCAASSRLWETNVSRGLQRSEYLPAGDVLESAVTLAPLKRTADAL